MKTLLRFLAPVAGFLAPVAVFAQGTTGYGIGGNKIQDLLGVVADIFKIVIPILVTLAVIWLIWNIIRYAVSGDEEEKSKARSGIIMGFIGLFLIVSIWGVISLLNNTFGIGRGGSLGSNEIPSVYIP